MTRSTERIATRPSRDQLSRRTARWVGAAGFLGALALPFILWHRAMSAVASDFRLDFDYLFMGWTGYFFIAAGLLFMLPVVLSIGRSPDSRLYPRSRNAYAAWGIVLYLLGSSIAVQVAQIASGLGD